jgi:hypothetical protein
VPSGQKYPAGQSRLHADGWPTTFDHFPGGQSFCKHKLHNKELAMVLPVLDLS